MVGGGGGGRELKKSSVQTPIKRHLIEKRIAHIGIYLFNPIRNSGQLKLNSRNILWQAVISDRPVEHTCAVHCAILFSFYPPVKKVPLKKGCYDWKFNLLPKRGLQNFNRKSSLRPPLLVRQGKRKTMV